LVHSGSALAGSIQRMILYSITKVGAACLILGLVLASGCGKSPDAVVEAGGAPADAAHLEPVGFQLDWYPAPEHGGEYQALVRGYYRAAGLDVTISPGGPGGLGIQKVATGRVQFSMGACDDVILAVKQGAPLLIVGAHMEHNPQAVMVHDESPVRSFRDLNGRSVMCIAGSTWISYVQEHYGITFSVMPSDWGLARFMADKDFIQQCFITNEPYYVGLHGQKARSLLIADAGYDPYRVIFTSKSFAREHPQAVRAFVAATTRGWIEYMNGDGSQARARIHADNPSQSPELMAYSVAMMKKYKLVEGDPAKGERAGLITRERMSALVQTLVDLKILDARLPLEDFMSFDFLPPQPGAGKT
jgi:NitT/TauT family transport system substrate-binding protein